VHSHVLELSRRRVSENKYPVTIKFWEDICGWLSEFPDLVYRHFAKHFPMDELEEIRIPASVCGPRTTLRWPVTLASLKKNAIPCIVLLFLLQSTALRCNPVVRARWELLTQEPIVVEPAVMLRAWWRILWLRW